MKVDHERRVKLAELGDLEAHDMIERDRLRRSSGFYGYGVAAIHRDLTWRPPMSVIQWTLLRIKEVMRIWRMGGEASIKSLWVVIGHVLERARGSTYSVVEYCAPTTNGYGVCVLIYATRRRFCVGINAGYRGVMLNAWPEIHRDVIANEHTSRAAISMWASRNGPDRVRCKIENDTLRLQHLPHVGSTIGARP